MTSKDQARSGYAQRKAPTQTREEQLWRNVRTAYGRVENLGAALADTKAELDAARAQLTVSEPSVYTREAPWSFVQDVCRAARHFGGDGDKSPQAAEERLSRHARETELNEPARRASDTRARHAAENALSRTPAEARALERYLSVGGNIFETRALSRTDGQSGYFTVPDWLITEFVPAARAGQPFASLWTDLPLPSGITSISLPQIVTGSASPFVADGQPGGGRDIRDAHVTHSVATALGQTDMSMQWLELNPVPAADAIIMPDLAQDAATQLDAQCLLGNGNGVQLQGVLPAGVISGAVNIANTNNASTSPQTLVNGGTASSFSPLGSVYQTLSQLTSVIGRTRNARATHWIMPEQIWSWICGQTDSVGQPIVKVHGGNLDDSGSQAGDYAGCFQGLPVVVDPQLPVSFGGTMAPSLAGIGGNGLYATQAGNGSYPAILAGRWRDCFLWSSPEPKMRVLPEVLSGTGQVRVQLWSYHVAIPERFQAAAAVTISDPGSYTTGGVSKGNPVSYGAWSQQVSNSPLSATNLGAY